MSFSKCEVCGREQIKTENEWSCRIVNGISDEDKEEFTIPIYNIDIMTHIQGVGICEDCMETYCKIDALQTGRNFSRVGNHYFADGRNLKDEPYTEEEFESKIYYTAEPVFKVVSKEEFDKFVEEYPNKLESDCCAISEPPLVTLNDFTIATHWPDSVVAKYDAGEPNEYYGLDYKRTYRIMENYKEVLNSIVEK